MSDLSFILSSLKSRCLNSVLSVFLTAFGVMLAIVVIQFGHHVQNRLSADGKDIDIVVGAKGSPLQLILSSVYHIDIPTGNIPYDDAQKWMKHPHIKSAIPLALGDNWKGYRIVGTTADYLTHYSAEINEGRLWDKAFEAVAGSSTGLRVGDKFEGAHGLLEGGHVHEKKHYKITGVMRPTGTVLDRLILTSLDSVLEIHGQAHIGHSEHEHETHHHHHKEHEEHHAHHGSHESHKPEITALLLTTKSPIANINLPRSINRDSALQAANPALEMARLTSMLGLGSKSFTALSAVLIAISALSIFSGLAGSLENRMGDLAVLRAIGYSKKRIFKIITLEGMSIVVVGLISGIFMGIAGFLMLIQIIAPLNASGASFSLTSAFFVVIIAVIVAGFLAAAVPALRASKVDIARQLTRGT
jgi:putative ABC transport system permease protein